MTFLVLFDIIFLLVSGR